MKFCSIFFGALAYILPYSYPLRKIMRESCFKDKFIGEILVLRNWKFWGLGPFPGIKNKITWFASEHTFFTLIPDFMVIF